MTVTKPPRIYFGGKIAKNDWRGALGGGEEGLYDYTPRPTWPEIPVSHNFDGTCMSYVYTGPYFVSCDHGCYHGVNTHGGGLPSKTRALMNGMVKYHGGEEEYYGCAGEIFHRRADVRDRCLEAIRRSDIMFVWLDSLSAYGTLIEAGYAHALGKRLWVAYDGPVDAHVGGYEDMWFLFSIAEHRAVTPDPSTARAHFLTAHLVG